MGEMRTNVLPISDLNIQQSPNRFLDLGTDVAPVLSIMTARSPSGPRALQADLQGKLATANLPYFVDATVAPTVANTATFQPANVQLYFRGVWVVLGSQFVAGQAGAGQLTQVLSVVGPVVTVRDAIPGGLATGDPVIMIGPPIPTMATTKRRPWDFTGSVTPALGVQATINLPNTGDIIEIDTVQADYLKGGGAAAQSGTVRIRNTLSNSIPWARGWIVSAATVDRDRIDVDDMGLQLVTGNQWVVEFNAAPTATDEQVLFVGCYTTTHDAVRL